MKKLIIGGLALATIGLVVYFKRQYDLLSNACYTVSGAIVHTLGINSVKITIFIKVVNESDLTLEISNMIFNIYVNKMFVSKISKPAVQILYSKADAIIQLDVDFNPKDLLKAGVTNIDAILNKKDSIAIDIKGAFSAKTGVVKLNNFTFDETVTLQELMTPSTIKKKC